jgi:hypothetical protein
MAEHPGHRTHRTDPTDKWGGLPIRPTDSTDQRWPLSRGHGAVISAQRLRTRRILSQLALPVAACALTTSALVLAQAPVPSTPQEKKAAAPLAKAKAKVEVAKKAAEMERRQLQARLVRQQNLEPMIQQFTQQGRPMAAAEVLFVRAVCKVGTPKLREIAKEAQATLKDVAKKLVEVQQNGAVRVRRGQGPGNPDARKMLQQELAAAFKKHLTPDEWAQYDKEIDKRDAERRKAALAFLVDSLDRELLLSRQQRDKLSDALSANWDDAWCMYIEYLMYGNQFFPQGIDKLVTPVLNETQKKAWQTAQKVQGFWGFGGVWNVQNNEDLLAELLGEEKKVEPVFGKAMMKKAFVRKVEAKK